MRSKNYFYKEDKFINYDCWKEDNAFFLFPTIVINRNLLISTKEEVTRVIGFFFKWRFCLDFGKIKVIKKDFSLNEKEVERFIHFCKKYLNKTLYRKDLEGLIKKDEHVKEFLKYNSLDHFYVKRYVLEKLFN